MICHTVRVFWAFNDGRLLALNARAQVRGWGDVQDSLAENQALRSQSLPHLLTVRIALSQRLLCPTPQQLYVSTMLRLMLDQMVQDPFRCGECSYETVSDIDK